MHDSNDKLLNAIADAFEDGRDPFSTEFLREHNVTANDCVATLTLMAALTRGYLSAPVWVQDAVLASGVSEPQFRDFIWKRQVAEDAKKRLTNIKPLRPGVIHALRLLATSGAFVYGSGAVVDTDRFLGSIPKPVQDSLIDLGLVGLDEQRKVWLITDAGRVALEMAKE